jgi:ABC-type glycerol-3-phosphate transport system permease component
MDMKNKNKRKSIYTICCRIAVIILMLFPVFVYAQQSFHSLLETAQYWEKEKNLQSAAYFYKEYITSNSNADIGIYYKCGMLMKELYHYSDAEYYLEKVINSDSVSFYPEALFWLGMVQKNKGKYEDAKYSFLQYQTRYASAENPILQKRVTTELSSFHLISKLLLDTFPVEIKKVESPVNTEYSEFNGIQFYEEALYFSSIRQISNTEHNNILEDFYMSMIITAPYTVNGIIKTVPLPVIINNPKYNNGNFCFNGDKTKLYFTRCPISGKDRNCAIWVSEWANHKWNKPQKLDKIINKPNSNTTQPYLASDDENQIFFFVSDREDGLGGMDIWFSLLNNNDDFSEPVNLGSIVNTQGNEITPFYHTEKQTLYFSSDWHEGLGGFDIFKSKGALSAWEKPVNMGYPINSSANDMYFTINDVDQDGFLTSNRIGSYYMTDETCCNDIYEYRWLGDVIKVQKDTFLIKNIEYISKSINDVLPVTLYFHNDEPDPKSLSTTTSKDYKTTLEEYIAMTDIYKTEYSFGLQGEEKEKAITDIDTFFLKTVGNGFAHLEQITQWLLEDLKQGNNVYLTIIGFASPLHSDDYNARLSSRRISSLKNYIKNQTVFDTYLDTVTVGNKLYFIEDPRGKRFAAEYVSDNPNDVRNSIYSIAAGMERRIQITLYKSEKDTSIKKPVLLVSEKDIIVTQIPETDVYELYIQIKNNGNADLEVKSIFSDNTLAKATVEKQLVQPEEKTFVCIRLSSEIFNLSKEIKINLQSNTKEEYIDIKLNP